MTTQGIDARPDSPRAAPRWHRAGQIGVGLATVPLTYVLCALLWALTNYWIAGLLGIAAVLLTGRLLGRDGRLRLRSTVTIIGTITAVCSGVIFYLVTIPGDF